MQLGEFWINNGFTLDKNKGFTITQFAAFLVQSPEYVQLNWSVTGEKNMVRYDVEYALSKDDLDNGKFTVLTTLPAANPPSGQQNYTFRHSGLPLAARCSIVSKQPLLMVR